MTVEPIGYLVDCYSWRGEVKFNEAGYRWLRSEGERRKERRLRLVIIDEAVERRKAARDYNQPERYRTAGTGGRARTEDAGSRS